MTNNALTPRFLLTLQAPWRAVRVGSQVFLGWKRRKELFHPGKHEQQCRERDAKTVQAAPQCACSFISSSPLSVPWIGKKKPKQENLLLQISACMPPPRRSLLEPLRLIFEFSAGDSSSLSLSLPPCGARFVCPRVRPTTRADCTFSARSSRSPSTKPPHWEDSADVTGGVHRRGGIAEMYVCVSVCRCACARFWKEWGRIGGTWGGNFSYKFGLYTFLLCTCSCIF